MPVLPRCGWVGSGITLNAQCSAAKIGCQLRGSSEIVVLIAERFVKVGTATRDLDVQPERFAERECARLGAI